MRTTGWIKLLAIMSLCPACDRTSELGFESGPEQVRTIAELKARCTKDSFKITEPITIHGTVTGTDRYGEFYKTLIVEDATGGIAVAVDKTWLNEDFPFGATITVYCNGLVLCDYGGKIELGTTPGEYGAGRIPQNELSRYIRHRTGTMIPKANILTFTDIAPKHIDTFVGFEGVRFATEGPWCETDPATQKPLTTERLILDVQGRTFTVRVPATSTYATDRLPLGTGSLKGIIDYFGGKYTLRITNFSVAIPSEAPPIACP